MHNLTSSHISDSSSSRWIVEGNETCSSTTLGLSTVAALEDAFLASTDSNQYIRDVTRKLSCDNEDVVADNIDIVFEYKGNCFTHVHRDHLSVYDFSGWVQHHPGGEYNIMKWAEGWDGHKGWYLDYPLNGNSTRKIPKVRPTSLTWFHCISFSSTLTYRNTQLSKHPMSRWDNNAEEPNIEFVARFGDSILYRDLPNQLKTDAVADFFGAVSDAVLEGGVVVCGSIGEGELFLF